MAAKTSQLQIRVTREEKAALKRLAGGAGVSVSRYVLAQALPSRNQKPSRAIEKLAGARGPERPLLQELADLLSETPPDDFAEALASPPIEPLNSILRNKVAGMVEQAAHAKSVDPPPWVDDVAPPARPYFGWPLSSLRPHQIRVTPVPFKKRGIFFDPASPRGVPAATGATSRSPLERGRDSLQRFAILDDALAKLELKVEFYFLGGALLFQSFRARPATAHISALFQPPGAVADTVASLREREAWPTDWLQGAAKEYLVGGVRPDRYLELANLSVFVPPLEYVLALKVAALGLQGGERALDDLRYVVRALNLTDPEAALEVTTRYFGERHLAADARTILEGLLGK